MAIETIILDYNNPKHAEDLVYLLNCYAVDPMGGGDALSQDTKDNLASELAKISFAFSVVVYKDGKPAGLANCFEGFSTFKCKPLVNIHDMAVCPNFRRQGISQILLDKVEAIAKEKGACKITLEVLSGNQVAQGAYFKFGFKNFELDPEAGQALFLEKALS